MDHAKNEDDQKRIAGQISTLGGMITSWSSKKQQTVALSSTGAEYYSYSAGCQEAMFTNMLLRELFGKDAIKPAILKEDTGRFFW